MHVALIAKPGHFDSGVGRYTRELKRALENLGHRVTVVHPSVPLPRWFLRALQRWPGWDLEAFFFNYPIWIRYPQADIYHFTSQNLATLMLLGRPPGNTVITVHDVIPRLVRDDPELRFYRHRLAEWFDRLALAGLRRADRLVADSEFTQMSLKMVDATVADSSVAMLGVD